MIWFTADSHFGHENIIKFCKRPFGSVEEMDIALARNWNKVVAPSDTVYHLGDVTLQAEDPPFYLLNGKIKVLSMNWHHDRRWIGDGRRFSDVLVPPLVVLEVPEVIVLCHYPLEEWDRKRYGSIHLHGHQHNKNHRTGARRYDIGVDANNFTPVSIEQVREWICAEPTARESGGEG